MKYIIQIWKGDKVGSWHNTNFGGDDKDFVINTAKKVSERYKVRVLELIVEFEKK